jgi:hypothetical protein
MIDSVSESTEIIYFESDYFWVLIFLILLSTFGLTYLDFIKTGHFHFIGILIGFSIAIICTLYYRRAPWFVKVDKLNKTLLVHPRWPHKEYCLDIKLLTAASAKIVVSGKYCRTHLDLVFSDTSEPESLYFNVDCELKQFAVFKTYKVPDEVSRLVNLLNEYTTDKEINER